LTNVEKACGKSPNITLGKVNIRQIKYRKMIYAEV
jgi:hypothetical protein